MTKPPKVTKSQMYPPQTGGRAGVMPTMANKRTKKSILIVEDESDLSDLLRYNLEREGYACRCAEAGDQALELIGKQIPELVLVDRMLPGISGDDVVMRLKADPQTSGIPIIVLTAKGEESDELVGFALGADDYITKPFSMKVLLARIAALFRRSRSQGEPEVLIGGPVRLIPSRHEVTVNQIPISLTPTEFRLIRALMAAQGRVLDRSRIIERVLGPVVAVTDRTVDVHITSLRRKLGPGADWVQTIRGAGYAFRAPAPVKAAWE